MSVLNQLEPKNVFHFFEEFSSIPHGSYNTKGASDYLVRFAQKRGLKYRQDEVGNVVIFKDATPGYENAPVTMLQSHMDMVCAQTEDSKKDMVVEPIDLETDGVHIWAKDTTLGADDGIGVALTLAILDDVSLKHPAIEALFTIDEEVGLDGATALDCSDLKASRLINLDSEEEGVFTVCCSGGGRLDCTIPAKLTAVPEGYLMAKIKTYGFLGGHSGCDIVDGRKSATVELGRFLYFASTHNQGMLLVSAKGGKFDNVITSSAEALIAAPSEAINSINSMCLRYREKLKEEVIPAESAAEIRFELLGKPVEGQQAYNLAKTQKIVSFWNKAPQGVLRMLPDFEGVPETSINLGILNCDEESFRVTFAPRSAVQTEKEKLFAQVEGLVKSAGGSMQLRSLYSAWEYRPESPFRDLAAKVYEEMFGKAPIIAATHGGLECGILCGKMPHIDAVSMGPDMRNVHSPREVLFVASTERIYKYLCKFLEESSEN